MTVYPDRNYLKRGQIWNLRIKYLKLGFLLFYNCVSRCEGICLSCLSHLGFIATHIHDFQGLIIFCSNKLRLKYSSSTVSTLSNTDPKQVSPIFKLQSCTKKWKIQGKVLFSTTHLKYCGQGLLFSNSIGVKNLGCVHRNCDFTLRTEKKSIFSWIMTSYIFGND